MRFRLSIVLLLLLAVVISACGATPKPGPSPVPQMSGPVPQKPAEAAEAEAQESNAEASEASEQEDSSEAVEPEGEAAESSDTGPLSIAECIASPDMYTWSHTMTSKEEGSRGWTCRGRLIIKNTSNEPLVLDLHKDQSMGTYLLAPWVWGEVTLPTATPEPEGTVKVPVGDQYHEWQHQRILAPKETYKFDSNLTVYDNGLKTYTQITRILLRRKVAGCVWFTPADAEVAGSAAERPIAIPNPCLGAPSTDGG
jgi:hypothetical protein